MVTNHWKQYEVAGNILIAKKHLAYAEFIAEYPESVGKRDFDLITPVDRFYRNLCSLAYSDAILLISSLVKMGDSRVMSFWNWPEFVAARGKELQCLTNEFERSGQKTVRDQMIAHQDSSNRNNNVPSARRLGIRTEVIKQAQSFLQKLIDEFFVFTNESSPVYSPDYFNADDAYEEIEKMFSLAPPTLTDNVII